MTLALFVTAPAMPNESRFATWLRETRLAVGVSQTELGRLADLSKMQISRLESGEQTTKRPTAIRLAQALGRPPREALDALASDALSELGMEDDIAREPDPDMSLTIRRYSGLGKPRQQVVDKIVAALLAEEQAEYRTDANEETTEETGRRDHAPVPDRGDD